MLERALEAWRSRLGEAYVSVRREELAPAEQATFATHQRVQAILRPADRAEVQEVMRIASQYAVPIQPVSSGKNWGYGSRVPVADGSVLLDLSRLDRIVELNEELAYVTVEPGVTQRQLFALLQERGSRLWMDATGSSPECSLVGNTMERGFGHTPYGDHFANVSGLEVVLPTGECVRTGLGQFAGATATPVYRWGMGPSLDGLFSQSNLGIVTQMTIWLMPAPEYFQAFYFSAGDEAALGPIVDALRPLRQDGTIKSAIHIGNGYKVLSSIGPYPWEATGGQTPLQPDQLASFARQLHFGAWNGSGGLYGTRAQVAEARRLIKRALRGRVDRLRFLDERLLGLASRLATPYRWLTGMDLRETIKLIRPVFGLMQGIPTASALASTYWRKRTPIPEQPHPDRDGCGLLWCAPVAPLAGNHARVVADIVVRVVLAHGFEPSLSMTLLSERCLSTIATIAYDRDTPGEDCRAMACYEELLAELTGAGYYPYRVGIQSQGRFDAQPEYTRLLQALKETLDPRSILAPGRYLAPRSLNPEVRAR